MARGRGAPGGRLGPGRAEAPRGPTQRQLRVGELLRHALVEVLQRERIHDPDLSGAPITVSEVRVSPDLRRATCFVMPLGGAHRETVLPALARSARWLSGQVGRRVRLKYVPRLSFELDQSFDAAARVEALLRRPDVAADLAAGAAGREGDEDDGA